MFLEIHLWCDTCWPFGSQHGIWAILLHVPASRHWWGPKPGSIVQNHSGKSVKNKCWKIKVVFVLSHLCQLKVSHYWMTLSNNYGAAVARQIVSHIVSDHVGFVKTYRQYHRACEQHLLIFLTDTLTDRMGVQPILPIKMSITTGNDSDFDGHGDSNITCKHTIYIYVNVILTYQWIPLIVIYLSTKSDTSALCHHSASLTHSGIAHFWPSLKDKMVNMNQH